MEISGSHPRFKPKVQIDLGSKLSKTVNDSEGIERILLFRNLPTLNLFLLSLGVNLLD